MVNAGQHRHLRVLQLGGCRDTPSLRAASDGRQWSIPCSRFLVLRRAQRGFTLLEMMVVILLIGIAAAAVSVSVTQGLASARATAASGELAGALRATRAQAIVQGKDQVFELDTRERTYHGAGQRTVTLPQGMKLSITSAKEDRLDDHTGRIRFFPDGSSTGGHIVLQRGKRRWQVNVEWLTGAIGVVTS